MSEKSNIIIDLLSSIKNQWHWMIVLPLKSFSRNKSKVEQEISVQNEPPIFRFLFILLSLSLFILMPSLSSDFGITGDEHYQRIYGDKLLKHHASGGNDESYLDYKNLKYYGGIFDFTTSWLNPSDNKTPPFHVDSKGVIHRELEEPQFQIPIRRFGDVYSFRHLINSLVGFLLMLFTGLLAKELTGSWRTAFFALLFIFLSPRIFGHSMNNPKDIPFAAAFIFTLYYLFKVINSLPRPSIINLALLSIGIVFAINVRVGGLLLIVYSAIFIGLSHVWHSKLRKKLREGSYLIRLGGIGVLISIIGFLGGQLFWPWAQQAPFSNPFKALALMSDFDKIINFLFEGKRIWSDEVPWYYIPKWFAISSPLFLHIGLLFFIGFIYIRKSRDVIFNLCAISFIAIFPIVYAILKQSPLYDGMRHFIFVYPIFVILASWGWHVLFLKFSHIKLHRIITSVLFIFLLSLPSSFMLINHPYQYVYFNEVFGGVDKAYAEYETDYWMISMKGLSDWFVINNPEAKLGLDAVQDGMSKSEILANIPQVVVATNCGEPMKHYLERKIPNIIVKPVRYDERDRYKWDYGFWYSRYLDKDYLINAWPPKKIIYSEKVDNTIIGVISKRTFDHDYNGYQAYKAGDYNAAGALYSKVVSEDPKNELAWLRLAEIYSGTQQWIEYKTAIDKLMEINSDNAIHHYLLGSYYYVIKDYDKAKMSFEHSIKLDKKYKEPYFILAQLEQNTTQSLSYVEKYIELGGEVKNVLELGLSLSKKVSNQAAILYFEAEQALWSGDPNLAAKKMRESLVVNPQYKPALEMKKIYNKIKSQK